MQERITSVGRILGVLAASLFLAACVSGPQAPVASPKMPVQTDPTDPVLIRADRWTEWWYVGRFLGQPR